jgi:hypothetical protein
VDLRLRGYDKIVRLVEKGVIASNPLSLDIGDDVDVSRISGDGVTLYPGCRIYGAKTVVSAGCTVGAEGPVTLDDCRLGPEVQLKGGSFRHAVFLEKASMGPGAQVREGCLLEEEAGGAHSVGLKQTVLLPFVTLGSLINFCDCLMAGGTSRKDHSEVGSSYIHFNYTPDGGKATASLFGDVPRGVMLDRPPIFLGGQGAAVGPVRVAYGTVVAAGSILRHDVLDEGRLVVTAAPPGLERDRKPGAFADLRRVVRNNAIYLANLAALEAWYVGVRQPFFATQDLGALVYEGALEMLSSARRERTYRLKALAETARVSNPAGREFKERADEVCALFEGFSAAAGAEAFLEAFEPAAAAATGGYIETIQRLTPEVRAKGVKWLQGIVDALCEGTQTLLPSMDLVGRGR